MPKPAGKAKLSATDALEIFSVRPARKEGDQTYVPSSTISYTLADRFNVGERTIRDIWNRRSWRDVTRPLWTLSELAADPATSGLMQKSVLEQVMPAQPRKPGRPKATGTPMEADSLWTSTASEEFSPLKHCRSEDRPKFANTEVDSLNLLQDVTEPDDATPLPGMGADHFNTCAPDFVVFPSSHRANNVSDDFCTRRAQEQSESLPTEETENGFSRVPSTAWGFECDASSPPSAERWQLSAEINPLRDPFENDWLLAMKAAGRDAWSEVTKSREECIYFLNIE